MKSRREWAEEQAEKLDFRSMLQLIDAFLSRGTEDSGKLWNVLSALRGPDDVSSEKKETQTIPIRRKALPWTAERDYPIGISAAFWPSQGYRPFPNKLGYEHFDRHIKCAAQALGMKEGD